MHVVELRQQVGGHNLVEMIISGIDEAIFSHHLPSGNDFLVTSTPAGLRVELTDEKDVDSVIAALRKAGGKLVSVQPLKQSLEELFLNRE